MFKIFKKLVRIGAFVPVALGVFGVSGSMASTRVERDAWERAEALNTTVGYSEFILNHARSNFTNVAFCRLYDLSSEDASATALKVRRDYPHASVDFSTCETRSSARLFNI